jgi:hypothetical protein
MLQVSKMNSQEPKAVEQELEGLEHAPYALTKNAFKIPEEDPR